MDSAYSQERIGTNSTISLTIFDGVLEGKLFPERRREKVAREMCQALKVCQVN